MSLQATVERFLSHRATAGSTVLVAFSGGPDSCALLHALCSLSPRLGLKVAAAHLDHGLDSGSAERARKARALASRIGVGLLAERRPVERFRRAGESLEAAARRVRYEFLAQAAETCNADLIATGHHADDQRETVLLRILFGSGLRGLSGIPPARGSIVRPLLTQERRVIADYLESAGLEPIRDPTNRDLTIPRNRIRHTVAPFLRRQCRDLDARLLSLASASRSCLEVLDQRLLEIIEARAVAGEVQIDASSLCALPPQVRSAALGAVCGLVGFSGPSRPALAEVERQQRTKTHVKCDLGAGWRLEVDDRQARLLRPTLRSSAPFAYTLRVPGEIHLEEPARIFRLARQPVAPWMFRGSEWRAGLALDLQAGDRVTVRNRRPGDRIRPLGCTYNRQLKEVLIDRKVPRSERDLLPLLCIDGVIVWVPGITIDDGVRLPSGASSAWVAELEPAT